MAAMSTTAKLTDEFWAALVGESLQEIRLVLNNSHSRQYRGTASVNKMLRIHRAI